MKSSRKSSKRVVANLSESQWLPDPDTGLYYRYYVDENGLQQVQWSEPETPRTDTAHAEPLYQDQADLANEEYVDDETSGYTHTASQEATGGYVEGDANEELAGAVAGLGVEDHEDAESHHHHRESQSATGSSSKDKSSEKKSSKRDEKKPSSSKPKKDGKVSTEKKGKGKGKEKETRTPGEPGEPFYDPNQQQQIQHQHQHQHRAHRSKRTPGHQAAPTGATGGATQDDTHPVDASYGARSAMHVDSGASFYPRGEQDGGGEYYEEQDPQDQIEVPDELNDPRIPADVTYASGFAPEEDDDNDIDLQKVMAKSRQEAYMGGGGYAEYPAGYIQPEASHAGPADYEPVPEEEDDGSVTPTRYNPGLEPDQVIRGTQGNYEDFDSRYRVESSQKFQPGEVFKILWSEPQGQSRDNFPNRLDIASYTERIQLKNDWGEKFYVGFRRFIVVANDEGHCTCIPILTYIRQGCKKKGVKPAKHGIIYEHGSKPRQLEGEPQLGFNPIRLEVRASGERLARESRVNYSKLVTVEHNVKVFFIGNIHSDDFDIVGRAVDQCWRDKIHKRVKKGLGKPPKN